MSFKIVDVIKKTKGISGKHKRVLEAWASFANKDGTNIFCAKDAAAKRAGVSRDLVLAFFKYHVGHAEICNQLLEPLVFLPQLLHLVARGLAQSVAPHSGLACLHEVL